MNQNASYYLKTGSLILFIFIILGYSFYQARHIIFGPSITIYSPINGETYTEPMIEVKGVATNASTFTINDTPVLLDKNGTFDEELLLPEGYTIIRIDAQDKFGKKTEKNIQVILKEKNPPKIISPATASSTTATTTIH